MTEEVNGKPLHPITKFPLRAAPAQWKCSWTMPVCRLTVLLI